MRAGDVFRRPSSPRVGRGQRRIGARGTSWMPGWLVWLTDAEHPRHAEARSRVSGHPRTASSNPSARRGRTTCLNGVPADAGAERRNPLWLEPTGGSMGGMRPPVCATASLRPSGRRLQHGPHPSDSASRCVRSSPRSRAPRIAPSLSASPQGVVHPSRRPRLTRKPRWAHHRRGEPIAFRSAGAGGGHRVSVLMLPPYAASNSEPLTVRDRFRLAAR
jgi:hypothetical protein